MSPNLPSRRRLLQTGGILAAVGAKLILTENPQASGADSDKRDGSPTITSVEPAFKDVDGMAFDLPLVVLGDGFEADAVVTVKTSPAAKVVVTDNEFVSPKAVYAKLALTNVVLDTLLLDVTVTNKASGKSVTKKQAVVLNVC